MLGLELDKSAWLWLLLGLSFFILACHPPPFSLILHCVVILCLLAYSPLLNVCHIYNHSPSLASFPPTVAVLSSHTRVLKESAANGKESIRIRPSSSYNRAQ